MLDYLSVGDPVDVTCSTATRAGPGPLPPKLRRVIGPRPCRARRDSVTISQQIRERPRESAGNNPRRASRRSLIAFLGGLALLAAALLATGLFPVLSTVAAIVGIAAMIYGLAAGVMIVLNREDDGSPD
jgi:hypothetical protein